MRERFPVTLTLLSVTFGFILGWWGQSQDEPDTSHYETELRVGVIHYDCDVAVVGRVVELIECDPPLPD